MTRAQRNREADAVSPEEWHAARERENEFDAHPCETFLDLVRMLDEARAAKAAGK